MKAKAFPYQIPRLAPGEPPDYARLAKEEKRKGKKVEIPRINDDMLKRFGYNL